MATSMILRMSDIARCPRHSWSPAHFRRDGSCRCDRDPGVCVHCSQPTVLHKTNDDLRVHLLTGLAPCYPATKAEVL